MDGLTRLEQAALDTLLAGDHPTLVTLRDQLAQATLSSRERTGVGFYCNFDVPLDTPHVAGDFHIGDVHVEIAGLEHGAGLVLFVTAGRLSLLEGFVYGDESWPESTDDFSIRYWKKPRELELA